LEQNAARIHAQGLGLAAISYDSVAILKQFADRSHIGFPLLSDPDSAVIRRYGILNETVAKENSTYGIPYPGTYVLDRRGVVTAKYFQDDFRVRDTAESILLRQFGIQAPARPPVEAKHATLRVSESSEELRPGQRVTLSVEAALPPRVHVYAPGVQGYKPVVLNLTAKGFQPDAAVFPASKPLKLAVIHETVPVYQGRFRVLETITLGNAQQVEPLLDANRQLAIDGQFLYQACDDRECFPPETVPVKWTLKVMPFDRTRVAPDLQRKAPQ
jgi:hypothetical protein